MRSRYPTRQAELPISLDVYNQLQWASCSTGYQREDWEIAAEAVDEGVRRHDPNALAGSAHAGYQWKRLFLPDGTVLRTVFGGKNHHCLVAGDRIVYDKRAVSPSGFANAIGGIRRNAWKSIWILFPDSKDWKLADSLRCRERPRNARKAAGAIQPAPARANMGASDGVPPAPAESAAVPSCTVRPTRRGRFALAAFKARHTRQVVDGEMPLARNEGLCQPHPSPPKPPSPPGFTWVYDRRANNPGPGTDRRRQASE
jgi:hypothetical protein